MIRHLLLTIWGFSQGLAPIPSNTLDDDDAAETCAACHEQEYREWQKSRHSQAWNNEVFQEGFDREPMLFCVHCHAPTSDQPQQLRQGRGSIENEGVSCRVCHVRDQMIITDGDSGGFHDAVAVSELSTSRFCANCHEFNAVHESMRSLSRTSVPMQTTYSEWLRYRELGGEETCQSCHMPGGSHEFPGIHGRKLGGDAIHIEIEKADGGASLILRNVGAGHAIPTGDVFRMLTLEVEQAGGKWMTLTKFRKRYDVHVNGEVTRQFIAEDNRLFPGMDKRVDLPGDATAYRLRFQQSPSRSLIIKQGAIE